MMDVLFYRDAVLEIILDGQHIAREVYELRLSLFLNAVQHYYQNKAGRNSEVLEPFPHCFYDFVTKTRRYDELQSCIASIPELSKIDQYTTLTELTWELLHWIFTNPLNIKVVKESEISEYLTDELREETKLMSIPYPSQDSHHRFKITHQNINSTNKFLTLKSTFGSFYAYHGSPGHNFHSIIHRGLRCSLNMRRAYGPGTYLTSYLDTATSYATQYGSGYSKYSRNSGIRYCVAIVEVIKHPSINVFNFGGAKNVGNVGAANNVANVGAANNVGNVGAANNVGNVGAANNVGNVGAANNMGVGAASNNVYTVGSSSSVYTVSSSSNVYSVVSSRNVGNVSGYNNSDNSADEQSKFDDTSSKYHRYYVVNSDDLMRLKHLLVFY